MWRSTRSRGGAGRCRRSRGTPAGIARRCASTWPGRPAREPPASCLEPFREYLAARFADDAHVDGTVLFREVLELGFDRSYVTFVRELRRLGLRPRCEAAGPAGMG